MKVRAEEAKGGLFCGMACQNAWHRKTFNAEIGRRGAEKISATKRAAAKAKATTYRKLMGKHEHRAVVEKKLGRALRKGEIVHHIDNDRHNNHPDNLAVMTQPEHVRLHFTKVKP